MGSPAKVDNGMGAIAVYIYSLKNLPYTLIIIMKDITVINRPPISVTAQSGMLSQKPQFSIADTNSSGNTVSVADETPADVII